jgi:serine protease Do
VPSPNQPNPENGVVIDQIVPGSPAEEARLQKGDVIEKFNQHDVKNFAELRTLVSQVELGKKVDLEILRAGKPMKVTAQIKEQPVGYQTGNVVPRQTPPEQATPPNQQQQEGGALASVHVGELTPELSRKLDLPNGVRGVVVTDVDPGSGMAELQKGDVIEEVNQQPITSVSDYQKVVDSLDPTQPQVLSVCRHRMRSFVVLRPR